MKNLRIPKSFKEKDIKRSVWDLGSPIQMTMMQCLNIPAHFEIMKPTDSFNMDYATLIQSMPMNAQLISDWKLRVMVFKSNLCNYYSWMDNNSRLTSEQLKNRSHHRISNYRPPVGSSLLFANHMFDSLDTDFQTFERFVSSVLPSFAQGDVSSRKTLFTPEWVKLFGVQSESLLDMIGFPSGFAPSYWSNQGAASESAPLELGRSFNADYLLVYLDTIRNYCVNNQLDSVPYFAALPKVQKEVHAETGYIEWSASGYFPFFGSVSLDEMDKFFKLLRCEDDGVDLLHFAHSKGLLTIVQWLKSLRFGGHFLAQYEPDMLNGLLRKVDTSNAEVIVTTDENGVQSFTINAFRLKNRDQLYNDRVDVSGGRWNNLLRTLWGAKGKTRYDIPEIVGSTSFTISPKGITSTSDTSNGDEGANIGQIASVTNTYDNNKYRHKIYSDDHAIMMVMVSLVPQVTYQNGLGKGLDVRMFADEYYPQYDQLGFTDVPLYKYNALPHHTGVGDTNLSQVLQITDPTQNNTFLKVVGKNIAFIDLISNVGRLHGKFARDDFFESWVLKRTFERNITYVKPPLDDIGQESVSGTTPVTEITSYASPMDYQYPFVTTGPLDSNFVLQLALDIKANRPKGKRYMPTLGK